MAHSLGNDIFGLFLLLFLFGFFVLFCKFTTMLVLVHFSFGCSQKIPCLNVLIDRLFGLQFHVVK